MIFLSKIAETVASVCLKCQVPMYPRINAGIFTRFPDNRRDCKRALSTKKDTFYAIKKVKIFIFMPRNPFSETLYTKCANGFAGSGVVDLFSGGSSL